NQAVIHRFLKHVGKHLIIRHSRFPSRLYLHEDLPDEAKPACAGHIHTSCELSVPDVERFPTLVTQVLKGSGESSTKVRIISTVPVVRIKSHRSPSAIGKLFIGVKKPFC